MSASSITGAGAEVYTAAELARAAATPLPVVDALIARGELRLIAGTRFIRGEDAIRAGKRLRVGVADVSVDVADVDVVSGFSRTLSLFSRTASPRRRAFTTTLAIHGALLVAALWMSTGPTATAPPSEPIDTARLIFIVSPGPGGGGGGGGMRSPRRAPRLERRLERPGPASSRISVAEVAPPPAPSPAPDPEPLPSQTIVAPVVAAATATADADIAVSGRGMGEGQGAGIGEGSGGGTGGGPYRPGSGIEPPRLLREVKAVYTEEGRRRNITGNVLLEIVVRSDGSVGGVTVLQGLGAGLDQRAADAVRQWRFAPARRLGTPVDVIVEVAVEFTLR